jgi:2-polyprenyl-3-methyl-5-hydroxy-6-metoxy-1,4-benzoquinol methylase
MICSQPKSSNKITSKFFDGYAQDFDSIYGSGKSRFSRFVNRYLRQSIVRRFELTLMACQDLEDKSILDVGCGPGHYCLALARKGAKRVYGIDFAPQMIALASQKALENKVQDVCHFEVRDFFSISEEQYHYLIMMGFMDYIEDARACVEKAMDLCLEKAFFSFPVSGGLLAWQRKLRYRSKCPLYMYSYQDIQSLFRSIPGLRFKIRKIDRDFWVEAWKQS